jgi:predicted oxidoreductase
MVTSNLGFGTSMLTRNNCVKDALSNLEVAYDCGITHYDCAKLYGFGQAEIILGKFARNKRHELTITSKSGLYARKLPLFTLPLINTIRKVVKSDRDKILTNEVKPNLGVFDAKILKSDIESSLKSMLTDYIDFYMLHEASLSIANRSDLIEVLENAKAAGKIRSFGVASHFLNLEHGLNGLNSSYEILQHNNPLKFGYNFFDGKKSSNQLRIIYNIFTELNHLKISKDYSELGYHSVIDYILSHYNKLNASGITLFSSVSNERIRETAKFWSKHK